MIDIINVAKSLFKNEREFEEWIYKDMREKELKSEILNKLKTGNVLDLTKTKQHNINRLVDELHVSKSLLYTVIKELDITGFARYNNRPATYKNKSPAIINKVAEDKPGQLFTNSPTPTPENDSKCFNLYQKLIEHIKKELRAELKEEIRKELLDKMNKI